ncbi:prepilin peptidase [Rubritalea tangerina]|uniref:Prepilin peptidase n=2 Tax=Rubritalea tangerina TaxID=430798 RepID=A0ABW4ZDG1_9BACT
MASICLAITAVDLELMVIPRQLTLLGTLLGVAMAVIAPSFFGEDEWTRSLLKSLFGFGLGWVGLWLVVLLGKLAFGRQKFEYDELTHWFLKEPENDEEELCFVIGNEAIGWSEIFYRKTDKLVVSEGEWVEIDGNREVVSELIITDDSVRINDKEYKIEALKSLEGKARKAVVPREAMGMGDVDLLGMLGACFGPASLLLIIFAACVLSIVWAMCNRLGFGKLMPFGPSIIGGAVIWLFWGEKLIDWYLKSLGV